MLTVALSGSGVSFQVATTTATEVMVNQGGAGSYTFSVTPVGNSFPAAVTFDCTAGLPTLTTCSFVPHSVTPGSAVASVVLTVHTTAAVASLIPAWGGATNGILFAMVMPVAGMLLAQRRRRKVVGGVLLGLAISVILIGVACGGGSPSTGGGGSPGTVRGKYPITITATSGTIKQTTTVTLDVN